MKRCHIPLARFIPSKPMIDATSKFPHFAEKKICESTPRSFGTEAAGAHHLRRREDDMMQDWSVVNRPTEYLEITWDPWNADNSIGKKFKKHMPLPIIGDYSWSRANYFKFLKLN